jgi:cyclic beta-1,2-glucan synthetase
MINPVNHGSTPETEAIYKVEPYVVAADVYAVAPHTGRGGWTWYTGSAGWMYRLIVESLLGLKLEGDRLHVNPCLPAEWNEFTVRYRYRETEYRITVQHAEEDKSVTVDGIAQDDTFILLIDDRRSHEVEARVNASSLANASLPAI